MSDIMIEIYLISFLERTIIFLFVCARTFDQARTITRKFDRDFVRGEYNGLNFCRRFFYYHAEFFIMQLEKNDDEFFISGVEKMMMNFLLVEWKK